MLPATLTWWRTLLETEDVGGRRALLELAIKERIGGSKNLPAKKATKLLGLAWDLSWALSKLPSPIASLRQIEGGLVQIAQQLVLVLDPPPADFSEFLGSEEASQLEQKFAKRAAEDKLLSWLESEDETPSQDRCQVDVQWLGVFGTDRVGTLSFRVLVTSLSLENSSVEKTQRVVKSISDLHDEVRIGKRQLLPQERRLVEWIATRGITQKKPSLESEDPVAFPIANAIEWLAQWADQEVLTWEDGSKLVFHPKRARLTLGGARRSEDPGRSPAAVWEIALPEREHDSSEPSMHSMHSMRSIALAQASILSELELPHRETHVFVRDEGTLYRLDTGGMPNDLLALLIQHPELPTDRLKSTGAGGVLVQRLLRSRPQSRGLREEPGFGDPDVPRVGDFERVLPVKPVVQLRLVDEMTFSISAWARSRDGAEFVRSHLGVWNVRRSREDRSAQVEELQELEEIEPLEGAAELEGAEEEVASICPDAIAVLPRPDDVVELDAWLRRVIPRHARFTTEQGVATFSWPADGASTLHAVRSWLDRPRRVSYRADTSFSNLVKIHAAPRIDVTVRNESGPGPDPGIDWLRVTVEMEEEMAALDLAEIASALESSSSDVVLVHGARLYRREQLERYCSRVESLHRLGLRLEPGEQRLHVMQFAGETGTSVIDLGGKEGSFHAFGARVRGMLDAFDGVPRAPVSKSLEPMLRSYQRAGSDFLVFAAHALGGALLADDMGLGKTLQTIAALTALREENRRRDAGLRIPTLVICPASVAHNWRRETEKFAPELKAVVLEGSAERRRGILERVADFDLVIAGFAIVRRDADLLRTQKWLVICIDEAQAIKNPNADITRVVKSLEAAFRFALTGTPIENRLTDLWSIVDFVSPGYLGSLGKFEEQLKVEDSTVMQSILRAKLRPVLLRRLKRTVAPELPDRIEERLDCEMTDEQRRAYLAEVKRTRMILDGLGAPEVTGAGRIQILAALTRLRQICCEPELADLPGLGSGKVDELLELLPNLLEAGHKVLVFSQFVRMLEVLEAKLTDRAIPFHLLTGQTVDRMRVVDGFEQDPTPSVFLISLKAGATGLNLTSASHVILFDPWWSPAIEAQAIDRTHRIGQRKTVVAVRLITRGTIEERIVELQERKLGLVRGILEEDTLDRTLTRADFEFLLEDG